MNGWRGEALLGLVAAAGAALIFSLAGLAGPAPTLASIGAAAADVSIRDNSFDPSTLTIAPGTTVTWTHRGLGSHTVTAEDSSWSSVTLRAGQIYTRTFDQVGTNRYFCIFHFGMNGTIVVSTASGTPSPTASPTASPSATATTQPGPAPRVTITLPLAGSTISSTTVTAEFTATGVTIGPADGSDGQSTGHFHLFLDQPVLVNPAGEFPRGPGIFHTAASSQVITGLATGVHTLTLALGRGNHKPFSPTVQTEITFTTAPPAGVIFLPGIFRGNRTGW